MTQTRIHDATLAPSGQRKIDWVRMNMPLLAEIERDFVRDLPFKGLKVALSVHMEAKTARLCLLLQAGGADVYASGSNPLSTQDDVAAALAANGIHIFATHGCTEEEYFSDLRSILKIGPDIIIDDGADLLQLMHGEFAHLLTKVRGGCEETTTGIHRVAALADEGKLRYPVIAVNNAQCKYLFDNRYGTGQSVWDGINRTTNLIVAGKKVVVAGYGWCGKGVALRAKGLGADVYVTEIDPVKALEAHMDGFHAVTMDEAAPIGDYFVTVTGCAGVITERHFKAMKNGAILSNAGHFDVEVDMAGLRAIAMRAEEARNNIIGYTLQNGNTLYVLGEGRLVNLACGDGHPAEIMDMSFAIQALSAEYLALNNANIDFKPALIPVPEEIDKRTATAKLRTLGLSVDILTPEQDKYLHSL
ncbi:MAG: adenosylhomocysteinase [Oscillospiraceae bacterium]|jgi:adenosylhomocysteinase|nr:adenosylhomocysteinase [Oscillospiraceae bacterium]